MATWCWSFLAFLLVFTLEVTYGILQRPCPEALRYIARVSLLLPVVSLLGAKRPQDGPWNFVVLALWGVLASPAIFAYGLGSARLNLPDAWSIMLVCLIGLTLVNACSASFFAGLFVTVAQLFLLIDYLPYSHWKAGEFNTIFACVLLTAEAILFALLNRSRRKHKHPLDRLWLDYRRDFGLFWSLRVQERLNDAAAKFQWPIHLTWNGWIHTNGKPLGKELDPKTQRAILQTFRGLLRRFVSQAWINERLED